MTEMLRRCTHSLSSGLKHKKVRRYVSTDGDAGSQQANANGYVLLLGRPATLAKWRDPAPGCHMALNSV
jgi:hypothetical protein